MREIHGIPLFILSLIVVGATLVLIAAPLSARGDDLEQQFLDPPNSAKPRVWWHWMNGNVTTAGIDADLRWMQRIGVGGLHTTDAGLKTPVIVDERMTYGSEAWQNAFAYAAKLAQSLNLEFGIFSSPGWSLTGGPWVEPEQAMKKMVWSKLRVVGGERYSGQLPDLPAISGPFQNMATPASGLISHASDQRVARHGAETIVIAYKESSLGSRDSREVVKALGNAKLLNHEVLLDGDDATSIDLPLSKKRNSATVKFEFGKPQEIRSVTVSAGPPGTFVSLAVSTDGQKFEPVEVIYMGNAAHSTITFDPIVARFFRFRINVPRGSLPTWQTSAPGAAKDSVLSIFPPSPDITHVNIRDLVLSDTPRVHHFEAKAGFQVARDYYAIETPDVPLDYAVPVTDVIDITEFTENGLIDWEVPPGDWVILRLGYSLQGKMNHAASAEGTGLEVDKLDKSHVEDYFAKYLDRYADALLASQDDGGLLDSMMIDSYEIGIQNWSTNILSEFRRLRGYDPYPWLPALTGVVIGSAQDSDRFLWDFRRTLSDLLRENHYKTAATIGSENNLTIYGEALESQRWAIGDDLELRRYTDIPTAAMWMFQAEDGPGVGYVVDILGAASVAHIYGQNLVAVEALTSAMAPWAYSPRTLKPILDRAFSLGANRAIIHASVHQPSLDEKPGFTLAFFGQNFSRHETWGELAGGWMSYLARCSFLLQQGSPVADVAYFYGEEGPLSGLFSEAPPSEVPAGIDFDFFNADALLNDLTVNDGLLFTPSGMSYQLLYLGGTSSRMTLAVLRQIGELVAQGATIVGARPVSSPSLADDNDEFERLATQIWEEIAVAGRILSGPLASALKELGVKKDFDYRVLSGVADLDYIHRRLEDGDIYFVSNRSPSSASVEAHFKVTGREAEIWIPETGERQDASYHIKDEHTTVQIEMESQQSLFVVFRKPSVVNDRQIPEISRSTIEEINNQWEITVPAFDGNTAQTVKLDELVSWSEQDNQAIKYFSGTAVYRRELLANSDWFASDQHLILDLGTVREIAQVYVNGDLIDTLWSVPYRSDITGALLPGRNRIEVHVTNLWVNRLIGDSQPGAESITFTATPAYEAAAPLVESGMLGPVSIERWTYE